MKNFFLIIIFFFVSCSGLSTKQPEINLDRDEVAKELFVLLKTRDLKKASQHITYLNEPQNRRESLLFSQYHFMSCNLKKSLKYLPQGPEVETEEKLFKSTMAGIISIQRQNDKEENMEKISDSENLTIFPIDSQEVWRDEWEDISPAAGFCSNLPFAKNDFQNQLLRYSKETLNSMPEEVLLRDFDLLALAIDLGYRFNRPEIILSHYHEHKDNPYYKYIEKEYLKKTKENNIKVKSQEGTGEIILSDFILKKDIFVPRPIKIPFLLGNSLL